MAEREFEMRLERLFGRTPAFADADLFAARLESRLGRGWALRRFLIGGLGLLGGAIGATQILTSGLAERAEAAFRFSHPIVSMRFTDIAFAHFLPEGFPISGEVFWMSAAFGLVAAGFALTRLVREI